MMYSSKFVLAIRNNKGEILRESCNQEVFLPFHSEYSIRLKNNNNRKASAEVWVDGTRILGENRIIIEPNGSVDLDRFCLDGNLSSGRRLKFVPSNDERVQDPTSPDNGVVKVRFWLEEENYIYIPPYKPYYPPYTPYYHPYTPPYYPPYYKDTYTVSSSNSFDFTSHKSILRGTVNCCVPYHSDTGATVEGGHSNQTFREASIGNLESNFTEITLRLKPYKDSITVKETKVKYCPNCGKKSKYGSRFCSDCGSRF